MGCVGLDESPGPPLLAASHPKSADEGLVPFHTLLARDGFWSLRFSSRPSSQLFSFPRFRQVFVFHLVLCLFIHLFIHLLFDFLVQADSHSL